jgi:hypothetical protein
MAADRAVPDDSNAPYDIRRTVMTKLYPQREYISPMFQAVLVCLLQSASSWGLGYVALNITSDGFVFAMEPGDIGFNVLLGREHEMIQNLVGVARASYLTVEETEWLMERFNQFKDGGGINHG